MAVTTDQTKLVQMAGVSRFLLRMTVVGQIHDHTGKFIEEVKLPFRAVSLIREP